MTDNSNQFGAKEYLELLVELPRDRWDINLVLKGVEMVLVRGNDGLDGGKVIQGAIKKDAKGRIYVENFEQIGEGLYLVANYLHNGDEIATVENIFNVDLKSCRFSVVNGFPDEPLYTAKYLLRKVERAK